VILMSWDERKIPLILFSSVMTIWLISLYRRMGDDEVLFDAIRMVGTNQMMGTMMMLLSLPLIWYMITWAKLRCKSKMYGIVSIGEQYICIRYLRGTKFLGVVTIQGNLMRDEGDSRRDLRYMLTHEKVKSLFESLRNRRIDFVYVLSPRGCAQGDDADVQSYVMFFVYGNKEEELRDGLRYVESACSTAFPEADVKVLSGKEIERLLGESIIPLSPFRYMGALRTDKDDLVALSFSSVEGLVRNTYKGLDISPLPTIPARGKEEEINIGRVLIDGREGEPISIRLNDLMTHVAIFGTTGSGKTTTAATLALRLLEKGVNVLILDWHNEYRNVVLRVGGKVLVPGRGAYPLRVNPLAHGGQTYDLAEHVDFVTDMLSEIFELSHPQAYMLREALKRAYLKAVNRAREPTLMDLYKEIEQFPIKSGWDHETKMALCRRLKLLIEGQIGEVFTQGDGIDVKELLNSRIISVELGHLRNLDARRLLVYSILKMIYDYRTRANSTCNELRHVIIIEEARNILPVRNDRYQRSCTIAERMLTELRKYGEGIIAIAQSPADVSRDVLRNTSIKIIHAIRDINDVRTLSRTIGLDDEKMRIFTKLSVGEAVLYTPHLSEPVIIRVEPHDLIKREEVLYPEIIIE